MIPEKIHREQAARFSMQRGIYNRKRVNLAGRLYGYTAFGILSMRHRLNGPNLFRERAVDELGYAMRRGLDFYAASRHVAQRIHVNPATVRRWVEQERIMRRAA